MDGVNTYTDNFIAGRLWLSTSAVLAIGTFIILFILGEIYVAVGVITLGFPCCMYRQFTSLSCFIPNSTLDCRGRIACNKK